MPFENVWYASEATAASRSKIVVYDDVGQVDIDQALYSGRRFRIDLDALAEPQPVSQSWNWVTYLIVNLAAFPVYLLVFGGLELKIVPWLPVLVVGVNSLALALGRSVKWVVVTGRIDGQRVARCYFADGSALGWGGIFGGTSRLFRQLRQRLTQNVPGGTD